MTLHSFPELEKEAIFICSPEKMVALLGDAVRKMGYPDFTPYYDKDLDYVVIPADREGASLAWSLVDRFNWDDMCISSDTIGICDICGKRYNKNRAKTICRVGKNQYHVTCYFTPDWNYSDYLMENEKGVIYLPDSDIERRTPCFYSKNATYMGMTLVESEDMFLNYLIVKEMENHKEIASKYGVAFAVDMLHRPVSTVGWRGCSYVWVWVKEGNHIRPLTEEEKDQVMQVIGRFLADANETKWAMERLCFLSRED